MKCRFSLWAVCAVSMIPFGCGQDGETVRIDVSPSVTKAIEEAAPPRTYRFLALKESSPKTIEETKQATLFVCGGIGNEIGLKVVSASLREQKSLLFGSIRRFYINPNLISADISMTETTSLKLDSGETAVVLCEQTIHGRDYRLDALVSRCVQEMRKSKNSVLLIERKGSLDRGVLSQMVGIAFM